MKLVPFEIRQAQAILGAFAPQNGTEGLVPQEGEVDFIGNLEKMTNAMSARARLGVRLALWLVTFAPIWMGVALSTIAGLPVEKRSALLDRMLSSNAFLIRELALAMKIGASFALFASKSVRARSGYDRRLSPAAPLGVRVPAEALPEAPRPRSLPVLPPSQPQVS